MGVGLGWVGRSVRELERKRVSIIREESTDVQERREIRRRVRYFNRRSLKTERVR
jgi:hypothetical protein